MARLKKEEVEVEEEVEAEVEVKEEVEEKKGKFTVIDSNGKKFRTVDSLELAEKIAKIAGGKVV